MSRFPMSVRLIVIGSALCASVAAARPPLEPQRIALNEQFSRPESAVYDARTRSWYVSNVGGTEAGDGYISQLNDEGEIVSEFFADDLDDPKGLAVSGGRLYVADVTRIVSLALDQPSTRSVYSAEGAIFFNDVAVDPRRGTVYVSDTLANVVYKLEDGSVTTLIEGAALEAPNGLWVDHDDLLIATIGPDLDPTTFSTSAPGRILRYDLRRNVLVPASERFGLLDGLQPLDGRRYLVTDFQVGVYVWSPGDEPELILSVEDTGLTSTADIGFDRAHRRLLIPDVQGVGVALYDLSAAYCP